MGRFYLKKGVGLGQLQRFDRFSQRLHKLPVAVVDELVLQQQHNVAVLQLFEAEAAQALRRTLF